MAPRAPPPVFQLLVKTHKTTIFVEAAQQSTIVTVKADVLSALRFNKEHPAPAPYEPDAMDEEDANVVPSVSKVDDFDLCKEVKQRNAPAGQYTVLDVSETVKDSKLSNWDVLVVQFKDSDGNPIPIEVSHAPLIEEDDEAPPEQPSKGKRKEPPA